MVHEWGPIAFNLFGGVQIHWLGLFLLMGILAAASITRWLAGRQGVGMTRPMVGAAVTWIAISALVGGRLGYCLFYQPDLFIKFKSAFPYWGILASGEGGFSWHGSVLGVVFGGILYSVRTGLGQLYVFDLAAFAAPVVIFFSRLGSFVNGEILGRVAPAGTPLAMKYPTEIERWSVEAPEKFAQLGHLGTTEPAEILARLRAGEESVRQLVLPMLESRHAVQLYSALAEGLGIFCVLFLVWKNPRRSGVVTAWYLILAGLVGLGIHSYEWVDPTRVAMIFGFDRYQWLSATTVLFGVICYVFWTRTTSIAVPGWDRGANIRVHRRR